MLTIKQTTQTFSYFVYYNRHCLQFVKIDFFLNRKILQPPPIHKHQYTTVTLEMSIFRTCCSMFSSLLILFRHVLSPIGFITHTHIHEQITIHSMAVAQHVRTLPVVSTKKILFQLILDTGIQFKSNKNIITNIEIILDYQW